MISSISPERRDELLALLEDGPKACGDLAGWLTISQTAVKKYLGVLERRREVKRVGGQTSGTRWVLANYQPPLVLPVELNVMDDVDEVVLPPPPPKRQPKVGTRQAPIRETLNTNAEPSWWCGAQRDGFTAVASAEALGRMRHSKEARQVPWRQLA